MAALTVLMPIMLFFAMFPENGRNGFMGLPWGIRQWALVLAAVVFAVLCCFSDWELVWGSVTLLSVLAAVALFASVIRRRQVESGAWLLLLALSALFGTALVLVARDWARRQLLIAACVAAFALAAFIVRVGLEHETVPPRWERAQIVAEATADKDTLKEQFDSGAKGRKAAVTNARTKLARLLDRTEPPLNVSNDLSEEANEILQGANGRKPTVPDVALQEFDAVLANQPSASPPAVTLLGDAVHALAAAVKAASATFDSTPLNRAICVVSGHDFAAPSRSCDQASVDPVTSHDKWLAAKHELDVALASTRADVTNSDTDKAALEKLVAQVPRTDDKITVLSAVLSGPEAVWYSAFHGSDPALVPGPLGWVIVGALLLGLLTWLLKLNARQLAGPVDIAADDKVDKDLVKVLRVAVLQNVDEPGAAPGSPSANPVTTLLGIAGGQLSAVSKVVDAVVAIVVRKYGYRVAIDVTPRDVDKPAKDGSSPTATDADKATADADKTSTPVPTTVLVRICEVSNGATLASHVVNGASAEAAVREAGLWAAGYILNRSTRIPSWAAWGPDTAQALAATKDEKSATVDALEKAVREAPRSGLLLALLGQRYELAERRAEAINCYARAVAIHPRYRVARYRLAAALAMMRHDKKWPGKSQDARRNDLRFLPAAMTAQHVRADSELKSLRDPAPPMDAPEIFTELAKKLLDRLADDVRLRYRLVNALRRSERDALWSGLVPGSRNVTARFKTVVSSAAKALCEAQLSELKRDAADPRSWWQISYNAACGYASVSPATDKSTKKALALLEQTLLRPGIHQLKAEWVRVDPDLESICASDRFTNFVKQLRAGV